MEKGFNLCYPRTSVIQGPYVLMVRLHEKVAKGDLIIIANYVTMDAEEAKAPQPKTGLMWMLKTGWPQK